MVQQDIDLSSIQLLLGSQVDFNAEFEYLLVDSALLPRPRGKPIIRLLNLHL